MTFQVSNKLKHNLVHTPVLARDMCVVSINIALCSKIGKPVCCTQSAHALSWSAGALVLNYGETNVAPTQNEWPPPFVEKKDRGPNT
jgi:hypothetical protein